MRTPPFLINGWDVYCHALFVDQVEALVATVETARAKDAVGFRKKRAAKVLAAVIKTAFEVIPLDPAHESFRQGDTLGARHRHWRRAKFLQQYRLFYRYRVDGDRKVIVLAWVNDERTLRAYESGSDAYLVFNRMLDRGHPPDDWDMLLREAQQDKVRERAASLRHAPA